MLCQENDNNKIEEIYSIATPEAVNEETIFLRRETPTEMKKEVNLSDRQSVQ
jgi:hypothetical protein